MISQLMQQPTSFQEFAAKNIRNTINESLVFSDRRFFVRKCCAYSKNLLLLRLQFQQNKFSGKGLNKGTLEDCGDGSLAEYREMLDQFINLTSTKRGSPTVHHSVASYEQTKRGQYYFYPRSNVDADGLHTLPLNLQTVLFCMVTFLFLNVKLLLVFILRVILLNY